jgi:putative flavoprotein involved in K+ transport
MDAWIGVGGAAVGALAALGGQWISAKTTERVAYRGRQHGVLDDLSRKLASVRKAALTAGVELVPRVAATLDGRPMLEDGRSVDISNVIWCTGVGHDFSWINLPGFRSDTLPEHDRGVMPSQPGLYFIGLPFLTRLASAFVGGVGADAERLVRTIAARMENETANALPEGIFGKVA